MLICRSVCAGLVNRSSSRPTSTPCQTTSRPTYVACLASASLTQTLIATLLLPSLTQFVYPFTLEPHVLHHSPAHRASTTATHAAHVAYLLKREEAKRERDRKERVRLAPGWEGGGLVPDKKGAPSAGASSAEVLKESPAVEKERERTIEDELRELSMAFIPKVGTSSPWIGRCLAGSRGSDATLFPKSRESNQPSDNTAVDAPTPADDTLATFEDSLFSLFSQPVIAHSAAPGSTFFEYNHPSLPTTLKIALPSPPPGLNSLQAQYVWPSSLLMAHLVLSGEIALEKGQSVVELGAGTGLAGLSAALSLEKRGGGTVVTTDWPDSVILETLEVNYQRNLPSQEVPASNVKWSVVGHKWGEDVTPISSALSPSPSPPRIDHLLLSDILYHSASHPDLLASVLNLLRSSSDPSSARAHITAGMHGGSLGTVERFVGLAVGDGCLVERHGVFSWDPRDEVWRKVDEEKEELTDGFVWRGTLSLST